MKESDITPEVIKLSKEIAEHWRMEIYEGCWYIDIDFDMCLWKSKAKHFFADEIIPIPSISDCLERLRELGWRNYQFRFASNGKLEMHIIHVPFTFKAEDEIIVRGTPLEALLSILLEVLKND